MMSKNNSTTPPQSLVTPLEAVAFTSRVVTRIVDRMTGDRLRFPLWVAESCVEALKCWGIQSWILYGTAAWVEVCEDFSVVWAGCWSDKKYFWVQTQYGEVVDLNVSVTFRIQSPITHRHRALYSPPLLWSAQIPLFYRYCPEGRVELQLDPEKEATQFQEIADEIQKKFYLEIEKKEKSYELEFPNEPILAPNQRVLDDSFGTFKKFDRVLSIKKIPKPPI